MIPDGTPPCLRFLFSERESICEPFEVGEDVFVCGEDTFPDEGEMSNGTIVGGFKGGYYPVRMGRINPRIYWIHEFEIRRLEDKTSRNQQDLIHQMDFMKGK